MQNFILDDSVALHGFENARHDIDLLRQYLDQLPTSRIPFHPRLQQRESQDINVDLSRLRLAPGDLQPAERRCGVLSIVAECLREAKPLELRGTAVRIPKAAELIAALAELASYAARVVFDIEPARSQPVQQLIRQSHAQGLLIEQAETATHALDVHGGLATFY